MKKTDMAPLDKRDAKYIDAANYGAGTRSRTRDLLITSQLLYQLSYTGKAAHSTQYHSD